GRLIAHPPPDKCRRGSCYAVALRSCVTPLCYAFVLRLCVTPLCYAFVLRPCVTPLCYVFSIAPNIYSTPIHPPVRYTPAIPRASRPNTARRCARPAPHGPPHPSLDNRALRAGPGEGRRSGTFVAVGTTCARCSCSPARRDRSARGCRPDRQR